MPEQDDADRIIRRRSERMFRAFSLYLRWYVSRYFHGLRLSSSGLPRFTPSQPLIVYSNHPSWWDPAIYIVLCDMLFPGYAGFGPMDAGSLGKYRVLERMGVFGVPLDDRRGAAIFLHTALAVLQRPGAMLWITAEGAFTDPRIRPVRLRPGLAHLARRVPGTTILPLALDYSFWNESRPEALVRFGEPLLSSSELSSAEWVEQLERSLTQTMDTLAGEAARRDPALFRLLIRGGAGIGGVYDAWRWSRATLHGEKFDPSHEGER